MRKKPFRLTLRVNCNTCVCRVKTLISDKRIQKDTGFHLIMQKSRQRVKYYNLAPPTDPYGEATNYC